MLEEIFSALKVNLSVRGKEAQGIGGGRFSRAFWFVIPVRVHFLVSVVVSLLRIGSTRRCVLLCSRFEVSFAWLLYKRVPRFVEMRSHALVSGRSKPIFAWLFVGYFLLLSSHYPVM